MSKENENAQSELSLEVSPKMGDDYEKYCKNWSSTALPLYTGEPFESLDGHFVGVDGFVVPNSFAELELDYPHYVRNWVCKKMKSNIYDPNVEDWASDLSIHMRTLPLESKWRTKGFVDVIDVFNPWSSWGASARRFFGYVNTCLNNKYLTIISKQKKDALFNIAFSLETSEGEIGEEMGLPVESKESFIHDNSKPLRDNSDKIEADLYKQLFVDKFLNFVKDEQPHLVPTLEAIMYQDKVDDIVNHLSITVSEFQKNRRALVSLGKQYLSH